MCMCARVCTYACIRKQLWCFVDANFDDIWRYVDFNLFIICFSFGWKAELWSLAAFRLRGRPSCVIIRRIYNYFCEKASMLVLFFIFCSRDRIAQADLFVYLFRVNISIRRALTRRLARHLHLMYKRKKERRRKKKRIVIRSVGNEILRSRDSYFLWNKDNLSSTMWIRSVCGDSRPTLTGSSKREESVSRVDFSRRDFPSRARLVFAFHGRFAWDRVRGSVESRMSSRWK